MTVDQPRTASTSSLRGSVVDSIEFRFLTSFTAEVIQKYRNRLAFGAWPIIVPGAIMIVTLNWKLALMLGGPIWLVLTIATLILASRTFRRTVPSRLEKGLDDLGLADCKQSLLELAKTHRISIFATYSEDGAIADIMTALGMPKSQAKRFAWKVVSEGRQASTESSMEEAARKLQEPARLTGLEEAERITKRVDGLQDEIEASLASTEPGDDGESSEGVDESEESAQMAGQPPVSDAGRVGIFDELFRKVPADETRREAIEEFSRMMSINPKPLLQDLDSWQGSFKGMDASGFFFAIGDNWLTSEHALGARVIWRIQDENPFEIEDEDDLGFTVVARMITHYRGLGRDDIVSALVNHAPDGHRELVERILTVLG